MHKRTFVSIWKCLYICCLLFAFPSLHAAWTSPEDLSIAGQNANQPQIAVDPAGNATAIWQRSNGVNLIVQASTKPIGGSWQAVPDNLSITGQDSIVPQIVVDPNGNATAVWQRSDGANLRIQASSKPFGGSWQVTPNTISAAGQDASVPQIGVDDSGNVTAVWQRSNGVNTIIQASTKLFGGSWQAVADDVSAAGQNATIPQIAVDPSGNATAVWRRLDGANFRTQASTKPFGGSWQATPDTISPAAEDTDEPQVAVDLDGNATAIWSNTTIATIQAATKLFGGSWQAVPDDLFNSITVNDPQISIDSSGNATAVWTSFDIVTNSIQASTKPSGGSWQAVPDTISPAGEDAFFPQIAVDPSGNATAVWGNSTTTRTQASTKPSGGSWQAVPDNLSAAAAVLDSPQVAVDPNGNATAVWARSDGANTIIQSSQQLVAPEVLSVSPNIGPPGGGTVVTLTGVGFSTTTGISFGANPATSFVINSDSSITVSAPPGALGTVNVIVTTSVGSSVASSNNTYTYAVFLPPQSLQGKQTSNRFFTQEDLINVITWAPPSSGPSPSLYRIYHDAALTNLAGTVLASQPLEFQDHNRRKHVVYIYYIISGDDFGNTSPTASSIVVYP